MGIVRSLHRGLLVPECCVIKLACTMQTTQFPLWAMGGLYYNFKRAIKASYSYCRQILGIRSITSLS